jgi:carboxyl-terminal processing protease
MPAKAWARALAAQAVRTDWGGAPLRLALVVAFAAQCGRGAEGAPPSATGAAPPSVAAAPFAPSGPATTRPAEGGERHGDDEPARSTEAFGEGRKNFLVALETLRRNYYDPAVGEDDLYRAALEGMLARLDPPMKRWNRLLAPAELAELQGDLRGEVVGIGVRTAYHKETGYVDVTDVFPNSPAGRAGIVEGDVILSIDGKVYKGQSQREVQRAIRGKPGQPVALTLLRGDRLVPVTIVPEAVPLDVVGRLRLPGGIGYVRVRLFSERTPAALRQALEDLAREPVHGLVVDLRGNPGGSFDDAIAVAGLLLPPGTPVASLHKRGREAETARAQGSPLLPGVPVAVLVDRATASGAELVAGALREGRGARLVGERTFGKWSLQSLEDLPNGFAVKYTIGLFRTPAGRSYENEGMPPDVEVGPNDAPLDKVQRVESPAERLEIDAQLRTARALLASPLTAVRRRRMPPARARRARRGRALGRIEPAAPVGARAGG